MGRVKRLNSKVNVKQKTNADLPLNPRIVSTFEYTAVTTASQTVITLPFSVEQITNVKKNFFLFIDGSLLLEGASNDYQFTNISPNNTSSEITLNSPVPSAGLNILATLLGTAIQNEPSNPNLQAQINTNIANIANKVNQADFEEIAFIKDVKSSGVNGGSTSTGSYLTRDLNTLETNGSPTWITAPVSNQFTLDSGTYEIEFQAPAFRAQQHKIKLRNITDASDEIIGAVVTTEISNAGGNVNHTTTSTLYGVITINATKTFEIQHRVSNAQATNGFGPAAGFGDDEVYTQGRIRKLS